MLAAAALPANLAHAETNASAATAAGDVVLEGVFLPGARPRPKEPVIGSAYDAEFGAWQLGGNSEPGQLTQRPGFHPATRVIVDTKPLRNLGQKGLTARAVLAQARAQGYWPMRLCYEEALREQALKSPNTPPARGLSVLRFSVARSGKVTYSRVLRSKLSREAARCVRDAAYRLRFSPGPLRALDVELQVSLSPGDVQLPPLPVELSERGSPSPRTTRWFAEATSLVNACFLEGTARDPKLWGRLELQVQLVNEQLSFAETESPAPGKPRGFVDPLVVQCVNQALAEKAAAQPLTEPLLAESPLWVAYRLGKPPEVNAKP